MKSKQKLSAFTLTEILVVLVISTIVVGFAFTLLDLVQRHLMAIRDNFEANTELRQLEQQITIDFNRYHNISYDEVLKELYLKTPIDSILYTQAEGKWIRNQDTLPVPLKSLDFFFEGEKITAGKLDAIKIHFDRPDRKFLFISKENSAKTFFE